MNHAIRLQMNDFGSRRLDEELSDHRNSTSATGVGIFQNESTRRLQQTSRENSDRNNKPSDLLSYIYYRSDCGVMTTEQQLVDVCLTEPNIFESVACLDNAQCDCAFRSFISVAMRVPVELRAGAWSDRILRELALLQRRHDVLVDRLPRPDQLLPHGPFRYL